MQDDKQSSIVLIVKEKLSVLEPPRIQIPVDNTIEEIHIDIKGDTARPYPVLQKPNSKLRNVATVGIDSYLCLEHITFLNSSVKYINIKLFFDRAIRISSRVEMWNPTGYNIADLLFRFRADPISLNIPIVESTAFYLTREVFNSLYCSNCSCFVASVVVCNYLFRVSWIYVLMIDLVLLHVMRNMLTRRRCKYNLTYFI